jgi:RHS repeat-associated protein
MESIETRCLSDSSQLETRGFVSTRSKTEILGCGYRTKYDYDELGNLLRVDLDYTGPGDTTWDIEYVVDGLNRRVGKKVDGTLVKGWVYDGQLRPVVEYDGTGAVVSRFVYGTQVNVPELMVKPTGPATGTYRMITDHLGSVRLVVNTTTGNIAQRIDYDEFGVILTDTNPGFQPFGFAGGFYDHLTGLVRFGVRDYDSSIGRWTTKDPILFRGRQTNLYVYVGNDPVNRADAFGLLPGDPYDTPDDAAKAAINEINPTSIQFNREFGGVIYQNGPGGAFSYTMGRQGTAYSVNCGSSPAGTVYVGTYHTHAGPGPYAYQFSPQDQFGMLFGEVAYLGTPSNQVLKYTKSQPQSRPQDFQELQGPQSFPAASYPQ